MSIRTITLTIELDDEQLREGDYQLALATIKEAEFKLSLRYADVRVMEFSREAKP